MNAPASITITPVFVADLNVEGERMPIYVHVRGRVRRRKRRDRSMQPPGMLPWSV
jgi:hypothetical protein